MCKLDGCSTYEISFEVMGNSTSGFNFSCVIPDGWETIVGKITGLPSEPLRCLNLRKFHNFCVSFAKNFIVNGTADLDSVITKSFASSYLGTITYNLTGKEFFDSCVYICSGLLRLAQSSESRKNLIIALKKILKPISDVAISPFVETFFGDFLIEAAKEEAKQSCVKPLVQAVTGAAGEEIAGGVSKLSKAKAGAESVIKWGIVVDGAVFVYTVCNAACKYHNRDITYREFRSTTIKRGSATIGSIGMGGAGAFVGSLIFPGVGTFVGGFVGGIVGEYIGNSVGEKADDYIN